MGIGEERLITPVAKRGKQKQRGFIVPPLCRGGLERLGDAVGYLSAPEANRILVRHAQERSTDGSCNLLSSSADAEYLGAAGGACSLGRGLAILHCDGLGVTDLPLAPTLDTIGFHHSPPSLGSIYCIC